MFSMILWTSMIYGYRCTNRLIWIFIFITLNKRQSNLTEIKLTKRCFLIVLPDDFVTHGLQDTTLCLFFIVVSYLDICSSVWFQELVKTRSSQHITIICDISIRGSSSIFWLYCSSRNHIVSIHGRHCDINDGIKKTRQIIYSKLWPLISHI